MDLTCLIVDDNDYFLHIAREVLEQEGISVTRVASWSADAFRMVVQLQPDFVLVDISLSEESGLDLARKLVEDAEPAAV
ncbi:response regulator [Planotetraspora silvatica]|uniref:response regulator n=1 Tax=Planotetraspora silvatica TaxID=234614 RepID=UPI0019518ED3